MITLTMLDLKIDQILDIVRELRRTGLQQGKDFDFAYQPEKVDYDIATGAHLLEQRQTVFSFYNESLASWFGIKYAEHIK
jgi:UDP-N-acetyl-D-mannosaminuronate dehydrogenase